MSAARPLLHRKPVHPESRYVAEMRASIDGPPLARDRMARIDALPLTVERSHAIVTAV
jgi:hypothetical protein